MHEGEKIPEQNYHKNATADKEFPPAGDESVNLFIGQSQASSQKCFDNNGNTNIAEYLNARMLIGPLANVRYKYSSAGCADARDECFSP